MKKILDRATWNRREHFEFFRNLDEPFFGITTELDVTRALLDCKTRQISFFLYYHYLSAQVVHNIENLRYRLEEEEVIVYDTVHVTTTIGRSDHTFAFSFIPYTSDLDTFITTGKQVISGIQNTNGLNWNPETARIDTVNYSTLPWIRFTGLSHARDLQPTDSIPKITFGKIYEHQDCFFMPVSIYLHHGLADGYHAGLYLEQMQDGLHAARGI